jgi:hypothetical protein
VRDFFPDREESRPNHFNTLQENSRPQTYRGNSRAMRKTPVAGRRELPIQNEEPRCFVKRHSDAHGDP